jgi:TRAP-type C4-dicarboxylate transport system permease large subunit
MNFVIAYENVPQALLNLLTAVPGGKIGFMVVMVIMLIIIGMTIDATPATLIFTPLFMPAAVAMGFDPTHFIMVMVMGVAIGMTTPPYGVCLFSITTIANIPMGKLIKASIPFYAMLILAIILTAYVPQLSLFLPKLLGM